MGLRESCSEKEGKTAFKEIMKQARMIKKVEKDISYLHGTEKIMY